MARLQVRLQDTLRERIEDQAGRLGVTVTEYVVTALLDRLQRDDAQANHILLAADARAWFFDVLEDRDPLPDTWEAAALLAADIEG